MIKNLAFVALGGGLGASLRYLISVLLPSNNHGFPTATLSVNLLGCLLLGILTGSLLKTTSMHDSPLYLLLGVGLLGGFTTFSTFSMESLKLLQSGNNMTFWIYVLSSTIFGIALGALGLNIATKLV